MDNNESDQRKEFLNHLLKVISELTESQYKSADTLWNDEKQSRPERDYIEALKYLYRLGYIEPLPDIRNPSYRMTFEGGQFLTDGGFFPRPSEESENLPQIPAATKKRPKQNVLIISGVIMCVLSVLTYFGIVPHYSEKLTPVIESSDSVSVDSLLREDSKQPDNPEYSDTVTN